jgi:hypothetical protein
MSERLTQENVRAGLPVAWTGGDGDYISVDLRVGHPGRVTEEAVNPILCEVGKDLFIAWRGRPLESQWCWEYGDVEVITDAEYSARARRVDAGEPPI